MHIYCIKKEILKLGGRQNETTKNESTNNYFLCCLLVISPLPFLPSFPSYSCTNAP